MGYTLLPAEEDSALFFRLEGEKAERHGAIGYLRADFGRTGLEFWPSWFNSQPHLKTYSFKNEFDDIINSLRDDGQIPPFSSRNNMAAFCAVNPGKELTSRGYGYRIRTQDYSYYFRCLPRLGDYDIYCFAYDNRYLLSELAGQHKIPNNCYTILPSSGEVVLIVHGEQGYHRSGLTTNDSALNRQIVNTNNALMDVTRAQEEAMLSGSLFGWNTPAAQPWRYEPDGKPRPIPQKNKDEHER
mgnify:CR=1 FL=1